MNHMSASDAQPNKFIRLAQSGRVMTVTYDRGDGLNALSVAGMTALRDVARILSGRTDISAIILQGKGVFSAGADLKDPDRKSRDEATLMEARESIKLGPDMCQAWADLEPVTIAAIEGFCIGGGVALAAALDHRIAARDSYLRLPEVPLGMNMSWRAIPRLVALMGPSRAKRFVLLGQKLGATHAADWGLVDEVTEPGEAVLAATELAKAYAELPPLALRMAKQAICVAAEPLGLATSYMDRDKFLLSSQSTDQKEAIAAFLEKRAPDFIGD